MLSALLLQGQRLCRTLVTAAQIALPSGIGIAVGMYVSPKFTIPRVIGSLVEQIWFRSACRSHQKLMVIVASGLVLGEGTASIANAILKATVG